MAYILEKVGEATNIATYNYVANTEAEVHDIDVNETPMGSRCYVIESGNTYVLNGSKEWRSNLNGSILSSPSIISKGSIVNLDLDGNGDKQYRVLKCNGNVAQIVAMYDTLTSVYNNDTSYDTTMGTLTVAKYEGANIDTYLNITWYNTLTSTAKAAIIPENVVCDAWYWGNSGDPDYTGTYGDSVPGTSNYTISKYTGGTLNIGKRNVFALGVQDVIDYLDDSSVQVDTTAILRNVNIWKMFWNDEVSHSDKYLWLRSSMAGDSGSAWCTIGETGYLTRGTLLGTFIVRPVLNLDLSKIPYTIV